MCGIVGALSLKKGKTVNRWIREQLQDQLTRGREGFGVTLFGPDRETRTERSKEITGILVPMYVFETEGVLLHHRYPTSTPNLTWQTHPIEVPGNKLDWHVAHNGVIHNADQVRKEHLDMDYVYTTDMQEYSNWKKAWETKFNDSESVAIEAAILAEADKKDLKEGKLTFRTKGSCAFLGIGLDKKTREVKKVIWGRNSSNPLNVDFDEDEKTWYWSSEGRGEACETDTLHILDIKTNKVEKYAVEIPANSSVLPTSRGEECIIKNCTTGSTYQVPPICLSCRSKIDRGAGYDLEIEDSHKTKANKKALQKLKAEAKVEEERIKERIEKNLRTNGVIDTTAVVTTESNATNPDKDLEGANSTDRTPFYDHLTDPTIALGKEIENLVETYLEELSDAWKYLDGEADGIGIIDNLIDELREVLMDCWNQKIEPDIIDATLRYGRDTIEAENELLQSDKVGHA